MTRARCDHPLPAEPPVVLDGLNPARWRAMVAAADRRFERSRARFVGHVFGYVIWGGLCLALWRSGYPAWRVGGLAGFLAIAILTHVLGGSVPERQKDQRVPFLGVTLGAALTGGLHSPLLIALPGHFAGEVLREGWSRATALGLATFGVAAIAMACVPAAWIGPPIPDPIFTVTLVVLLLTSTALQTNYLVVLIRTSKEALRQLLRSREEQATEALARASQLEQLSSQLSHELKNPLGAIKALVQLSVRAERDPEVLARLEVVQGEVDRMQSILQGYLSFSRPLQALRLQAVDLGPLVDEVLAILEGRAAAARVTARRRGDATVTADPRSLKQALVNLVANAIEASPQSGAVEVRIDQAGEQVRLQVVDAGRGMSAEELARVGTPFFTTRAAGTGLGVSLARGVFAQHGGALEYQSEPGRGTTATAMLPTHPAEAPPDGTRTAGR